MMARISTSILFWAAWVIIPLLIEIIPAVANFFILIYRRYLMRREKPLGFKPMITLMIPVYNSSATLYRCIESIYESTYPTEQIEVLLVDNGSKDNSFEIFQEAQMAFPSMTMWWIHSHQGKSKALNKAIFNSNGKYVINIDSDGILQKDALWNIVRRFENHKKVDCMTGVILIEPRLIRETKDFFLRQFRVLEYMEYAQAFLAGRNFESQFNNIFTLSGAFSAFRKSVLIQTYLYNTNTICEDTHLTFQIKQNLKKRVSLCYDALFLVDPIENLNKYYTQRQRWQIGELEVVKMFMVKNLKQPIVGFFKNPMLRLIMLDHTFAFPRMIWYFAIFAIGCLSLSFQNIMMAMVVMYFLYVGMLTLYYFNILSFLKNFKEERDFYKSKFLYLFIMPFYSIYGFFVRFAGIINSVTRKSSWKTKTFTEEIDECKTVIGKDFSYLIRFRKFIQRILEKPEGVVEQSEV